MNYRIIYSLQFELEPGPNGQRRQLIVPLKPDGTATNIKPLPPKERAIDLRSGDRFNYQGKTEAAVSINAYRDAYTTEQPQPHKGGYLYTVKK